MFLGHRKLVVQQLVAYKLLSPSPAGKFLFKIGGTPPGIQLFGHWKPDSGDRFGTMQLPSFGFEDGLVCIWNPSLDASTSYSYVPSLDASTSYSYVPSLDASTSYAFIKVLGGCFIDV